MKVTTRRLLSRVALSVAVLGASSAALAQNAMTGFGSNFYRPGSSYIGFNVGQTDYSLGNGTGLFSGDQKDTGYGLNAGSFFNNYLGFELGMIDFGDASRGGGTTQAYGFNVSLIGKLPVSQTFNLLGKVGTTYGRTQVSSRPGSGITAGNEDGFGISYGIGAEYVFNTNISAVLQYDEHSLKFVNTDRERVGLTSVGLRYRF